MDITCNSNKNNHNIEERGLSFERVADFDLETALYSVDDHHEYDETRIAAIGYLENRWHVVCVVETKNGVRKANSREVKHYESQ